eukprot:SAG11_NODE_187_length_13061_cov_10.715322_11_plen_75_part_00
MAKFTRLPSQDVLCSYLSADVADTPEQGWEETTDAALTSMLRSALSKKDMVSNIVQVRRAHDKADSGSSSWVRM